MRQLNEKEQLIFNELKAHECVHVNHLAILMNCTAGNVRDWHIKYLKIKIQTKYRIETVRNKGYILREIESGPKS